MPCLPAKHLENSCLYTSPALSRSPGSAFIQLRFTFSTPLPPPSPPFTFLLLPHIQLHFENLPANILIGLITSCPSSHCASPTPLTGVSPPTTGLNPPSHVLLPHTLLLQLIRTAGMIEPPCLPLIIPVPLTFVSVQEPGAGGARMRLQPQLQGVMLTSHMILRGRKWARLVCSRSAQA